MKAEKVWERINKKLLEEANRAVRAFRVNRVGCRDTGGVKVVEWLVHYAGTDQPRERCWCGFRHSALEKVRKN